MTAYSMPLPVSGEASCPTLGTRPMPTPSSSANADARRLAAGVARGDEAAFREFYDRYEARLFRFGLALGHGDEGLAGEVVQAVFVYSRPPNTNRDSYPVDVVLMVNFPTRINCRGSS